MKYQLTFLTIALALAASSCKRAHPPDGLKRSLQDVRDATTSEDRDVAMQNRMQSFFHVALVPKLQGCWSMLKGKGEIII